MNTHNTPTHPETGPEVTITVDTLPRKIHRGNWVVADLKTELKLDSARDLDQVVDGQLRPLTDDQHVVLKGGEVFVSHVRQGGSS